MVVVLVILLNQMHAWLIKIAFVQEVSLCACVCVCSAQRLLITISVILTLLPNTLA